VGDIKKISLALIRENEVALRTVNRESEDYLGLVESIRQKGFMGAITVRAKVDAETKEHFYELIDGLHRFNASKDAGLSEINVDVVDLNEDQVLEAQIMTNIHKVETRPVEYSQQLKRILTRNPLMTESELAVKLGKSPVWIKERLGLTKITNSEITALINDGKIKLANAYALAKLPETEQQDFVERAMTLSPDEFVPAVQARVKEINEAKRQGKEAGAAEFVPTPHLQKLSDLKALLENRTAAAKLVAGVSDPVEAAIIAIKWALHLDADSVAAAKAKDDARRAEQAEAKKKRDQAKLEKAAAAAKDAAEKAAAAAKQG
jgi:ParB family chromosome partitioning protein